VPDAFPLLLAGEAEEDAGADQHDFEGDLEEPLSSRPMDDRGLDPEVVFLVRARRASARGLPAWQGNATRSGESQETGWTPRFPAPWVLASMNG